MKPIFYIIFLSAIMFACGGAKDSQVNEDVLTADSAKTEVSQQDTVLSDSETAEMQMDENVIMEIWDAYIK